MIQTKFTKKDLLHVSNLIRALKKAKVEMDGMECLAHAETMKWVSGKLFPLIEEEAKLSESAEKMEITQSEKKPGRKPKKDK